MSEVMQQFTPDERISSLEDRLEDAEEKLHRIGQWAKAYPVDVFIPPTDEDYKEARRLLGDNRWSSLNAHWARHILKGVSEILDPRIEFDAIYQRGIEAGRREPNE